MIPERRQRLRTTFAKGEEIKYISHLDLMRLWERALRRAGVPLAYSKGFNPRPRISLAAPLPLGFTGRAELMDVLLTRPTSPLDFARRVRAALPPGLDIVSAEEVYIKLPALQTQVRWSEYRAAVASDEGLEEMEGRVERILAAETLPHLKKRKGRRQEYNLRPLIEALWIEGGGEGLYILGMRLRTEAQATGRPDEVLKALGLGHCPWAIERIRLVTAGEERLQNGF